jgi:XTP/dITP diphosphohydrolase
VKRRPLIVATGNPGKLQELRALLADLPFDLHGLDEIGVSPPEETGASFLENALLKARHAAAAAGAAGFQGSSAPHVAALADDSGLEVDALGGAPGILSARYAGKDAGTSANNAKLLRALAGIPSEQRRARYRCALVMLQGAGDTAPLIAEGVWEGYIIDVPRGSGGFGYDPHFFLPDLRRTAAQLDPEEKNRLSHRGTALRALRDQWLAREGLEARAESGARELDTRRRP